VLNSAPSISFIVPSMNEATNVEHVVGEIATACAAVQGTIGATQLVLINDGSTDDTGKVIDRIASGQPDAICVHHESNRGLGAAYKSGVRAASKDYVLMVPGENSVPSESIVAILSAIGRADMVITYPLNSVVRKKVRQFLSFRFHWLTQRAFSHNIRYYNGPNLFRRTQLLSALPRTDSHAYQLEMILRLLRAGRSFVEVGINVRDRPSGRSKALRPMNVVRVIWTMVRCRLWLR
jgi:dolichol-phosphate mannosyltransferase